MSVVEGGIIRQLSVSQIESFDPRQTGGCNRRWWFERAMDLRAEQTSSQSEGEAGHALLAEYFRTGEVPKGRKLMGKAVTGAIVKGELPKPGPDMLVEERFDGQEKFDASGEWIPLDVANTLHLAGVPLEGFIDLAYRRGPRPVIIDHKFSADPDTYAKPAAGLIRTVQMPVYVLSQMPFWPDAREWIIAHHYVSKKGVHSFFRKAVVTVDQVLERKADIEATIERMKVVARATQQDDVPAKRGPACDAWQGCPHQSVCSAYRKGNTVDLSPEELAVFDSIDADATPTPPVPPSPPKERKMKMIDVDPANPPPVPPPLVPAPVPPPTDATSRVCMCGATINAQNGSKLQTGEWVHIGCPAKALPPPAPAPRERRPKKAPEPAAPIVPADTAPPALAPVAAPQIRVLVDSADKRKATLASLFENIAALLRE